MARVYLSSFELELVARQLFFSKPDAKLLGQALSMKARFNLSSGLFYNIRSYSSDLFGRSAKIAVELKVKSSVLLRVLLTYFKAKKLDLQRDFRSSSSQTSYVLANLLKKIGPNYSKLYILVYVIRTLFYLTFLKLCLFLFT